MTDEEVLVNDHYLRGQWMLERQVHTVGDLVNFWKLYGPVRAEIPKIELRPKWDVVQ